MKLSLHFSFISLLLLSSTAFAEGLDCEAVAKAAQIACDPASSTGGLMSAEDSRALMDAAQTGMQVASSLSNIGADMEKQCQSAADTAKLLAMLNGGAAVACKTASVTCNSTCKSEAEFYKDPAYNLPDIAKKASDNQRKCEGYNKNFLASLSQLTKAAANYMQSQQCADMIRQAKQQQQQQAQMATPCLTDPRSAACLAAQGQMGGTALTGGLSNPYNGLGSMPSMGDGDIDEQPNFDPGDNGGKKATTGGIPPGSGGAAFGDQAKGGRPPPAGDAGGAQYGTSKSILGGSGGGGGGGGFSRGASKSESAANAAAGLLKKFNLANFLPNKNGLRGVAGAAVKLASDGISGQMGPSNFEKVSRQMRLRETEMKP